MAGAIGSALMSVPPETPGPIQDTRGRRRALARPLLTAGYAVGIPGTIASPWIMRRRLLPAFLALELATAVLAVGWGIGGGRRGVRGLVVNGAGVVGWAAWWRSAAR